MAPVVLAVPLLAENRVGRTTPVALVVLLLKEDLDLTVGLMVQGHVVPVALVVQEDLGLTAGHMVRVGHMVAHPSRKGDPDRTANQISTTRRGSASLGTRGFNLQLGLWSEVHRTSTQGHFAEAPSSALPAHPCTGGADHWRHHAGPADRVRSVAHDIGWK